MNTYIGIDLGTSSVKLLLVGADGQIINSITKEYPIFYPQSGWSEQNPEDWLKATVDGMEELLNGYNRYEVKGISFGGQMHGLVLLDAEDNVIRPAILWNDGRTQKQTEYLNTVIGQEKLSQYTANIAFAGFTAPKILWVKENEPENFDKIAKIMLPKDYLAYKLTGVHSTDYSDASGMLLLDVQNKCWSKEMCEICSVDEKWLPKLFESYERIGQVRDEYNLPNAIVTAGAGDNAAAAIGTGTIKDGACNISLGTSGTVFIAQDAFSVDKNNALHSFAHANGRYHLMGCILSAASCNKWWMEEILRTQEFANEQEGLETYLGNNEVFFLPYLMGERSPHNDVNARGCFIGMRPDTTRKQMTLAVMEGVTFALRDCVEVAKASGLKIEKTKICGGGAKSVIWKKIIANVFGAPVSTLLVEEGPAYGAAILAMIGAGEYESVSVAVNKIVKTKETVFPDDMLTQAYERKYRLFRQVYPTLKNIFAQI
ncbi:MAG: xylulokinase [Clostridiales bacterium]|nr:xylulokinase [Clostridiales bacterium]MBE5746579.1 xylulokinase [Clostridiales bacterium]